jgi:hypothetical protein
MRFGRSQLAVWKQPRLLPDPTATARLSGSLQERLHPWNPVDKLIPLSSLLSRTCEVHNPYP